ncbi:iron-containing alcohol dehydrogenase [Rhodobacteraceae bacterium RKSG542]|uniref:iron-containing alcohol dehydrogenase n=1 Tax=Pseudovibrio flavus TaxID=2529854 RepID=UPI0012BBE328|nr:iron-containing alcohol dehydrogenase [Pseudovibrio flavus]MTI16218.1 iron-containing alcohol dehydrogenase [Pseudovibrio flavus]
MQFSYLNPTRLHFGQGQISVISSEIPKDARVLLVYGGGSIKKNGVYDQVVKALEGYDWIEFSGIEPNPQLNTLNGAVEVCRMKDRNYILAVGGGSVVDGAKYIAAAALYEGDGWQIVLRRHVPEVALPIGAVLTLPATGSETNPTAVVTNTETKEKLGFKTDAVRPKFAVLDPDTMKTLPERQLINGIVDAWVHICEQYITSPEGSMVQDGFAETLLRVLMALAADFDERDDDKWRANLMLAANQALNGFIGIGLPADWASHQLGHALTALYGIDHGASLSMVHPSLLRNQIEVKRAKLEQMGRNVFGLQGEAELAEHTINAIESFYESVGSPTHFSEYGDDKAAALDALVALMIQCERDKLGEHGAVTPVEIRQIFDAALV